MNLDCLWCWFYTGRPLFAQIISSSYSPARFCIFICIWIWMPTINHGISRALLQYQSVSIISRAIRRCHYYPICTKLFIWYYSLWKLVDNCPRRDPSKYRISEITWQSPMFYIVRVCFMWFWYFPLQEILSKEFFYNDICA